MATVTDTIERALAEIRFDRDGLVPAVAQQHDTDEILMVAWMNRDAVRATLTEGRACYWSRSRSTLWRKGETSGQVQLLRELRLDCDGDTVLLLVDQHGVACHTGRRSCFFRATAAGWSSPSHRSTLRRFIRGQPTDLTAAAGRTDGPESAPSHQR
jgi:phosphoribosyl-AMP cyclohydrolase